MRKKSKYGYIEFIDKRKLKHDGWDDEIEPEIRKPTPLEREEIILNYVRVNSGKSVKVSFFAEQTCGIRTHDTNSVTGTQKSNETLSKTERKTEKVEINRLIVFCFFVYSGVIEPFFVKI